MSNARRLVLTAYLMCSIQDTIYAMHPGVVAGGAAHDAAGALIAHELSPGQRAELLQFAEKYRNGTPFHLVQACARDIQSWCNAFSEIKLLMACVLDPSVRVFSNIERLCGENNRHNPSIWARKLAESPHEEHLKRTSPRAPAGDVRGLLGEILAAPHVGPIAPVPPLPPPLASDAVPAVAALDSERALSPRTLQSQEGIAQALSAVTSCTDAGSKIDALNHAIMRDFLPHLGSMSSTDRALLYSRPILDALEGLGDQPNDDNDDFPGIIRHASEMRSQLNTEGLSGLITYLETEFAAYLDNQKVCAEFA